MEILLKESYRMDSIIGDILELSRLERPQVTINPILLNVDMLLKDTIELFEPLAKEKHLTLLYQSNIKEDLMLDYTTIKTVLNNLISNAIKYSDSGVISIKINKSGNNLIIIIQDEGMGISKENIPFIFDRFFQVDSSRSKNNGTGLGLSIVKKMVELNNGKIEVSSMLQIGTTFTVTLPLFLEMDSL